MYPGFGAPCGSDVAYEPDIQESEWSNVERWRLKVLIDAGYSVSVAERIAARSDIDLHRAVELVEHGCDPAVAALILL